MSDISRSTRREGNSDKTITDRVQDPNGCLVFDFVSKRAAAYKGAREYEPVTGASDEDLRTLGINFRDLLSNFAPCEPICAFAMTFPTIEHAFHGIKYLMAGHTNAAEMFAYSYPHMNAPKVGMSGRDAHKARKLILLPKSFFENVWTPAEVDRILCELCEQKFAPGKKIGTDGVDAHALLMATGNATLEHGLRSHIKPAKWLMKARDQLRKEATEQSD